MITKEKILEEIENISESIDKLTWITLRKLKQPSHYGFEDLRGEAIQTVIEMIRLDEYSPNKGTKLSTFLLTAIRNHFCNIIKKTYKVPGRVLSLSTGKLTNNIGRKSKGDETSMLSIFDMLSSDELRYVEMMIIPPPGILEELKSSSKKRERIIVRKALRISIEKERHIRNSIQAKMKKLGVTK